MSISIVCSLQFITESYTLLLCLKLGDMRTLDDRPAGYEGSLRKKKDWLTRMSRRVVDRVFNPTSSEDVRVAAESMRNEHQRRRLVLRNATDQEVFPYCSCRDGKFLCGIKCIS